VDGSFLATLLETVTVGLLVATWTSVTEGTVPCGFPVIMCETNRYLGLQKPGKKIDITKSAFSSFGFFPLYLL